MRLIGVGLCLMGLVACQSEATPPEIEVSREADGRVSASGDDPFAIDAALEKACGGPLQDRQETRLTLIDGTHSYIVMAEC